MQKLSTTWLIVGLLLLILVGAIVWSGSKRQAVVEPPPDDNTSNLTTNPLIRVTRPQPYQAVESPLVVEGEARGNWYFEASFPVRLFDADGKELAVVPAQASGEWMTEEFVPFRVILSFPTPATKTGTLVLEKDNPSGLPEHAAEIKIPVVFK